MVIFDYPPVINGISNWNTDFSQWNKMLLLAGVGVPRKGIESMIIEDTEDFEEVIYKYINKSLKELGY